MLRIESAKVIIDAKTCRAVVFDMDGVVTDSVPAHRRAWKQTFDAFLRSVGDPVEFDEVSDYLTYVDGKPRYDGVRSFLESRGIRLPEGSADDPAEVDTVSGLGNRKNEVFLRTVAEGGIDSYETTLDLIDRLRTLDIGVALITSSRNAVPVLEAAGVDGEIFDEVVDGNESDRMGLPGKPHPAIFLEAAARLGEEARVCVVVEDAVSGVMAGKAGGFGGVIGIDRGDNFEALTAAGADVVVADLGEVIVS